MEIGDTCQAATRQAWRTWLEAEHARAQQIWLILQRQPGPSDLTYLDAVEEALCFGWIDGLAKSWNDRLLAQRFTPRRRRSPWTELNKERARRLIRLGRMGEAGLAALPDLDQDFELLETVACALRADPDVWKTFNSFPDLYRRVRVGYIQEVSKNPQEFDRRLRNFIKQTAQGRMFGNWNDGGRL